MGAKVHGKVTNLVPYGAFVEIEEGVEGLIHVSELSWTKRITRPSDVLAQGQEIDAIVLGVNKEEQKISLGVRQLEPNPWDAIEQRLEINGVDHHQMTALDGGDGSDPLHLLEQRHFAEKVAGSKCNHAPPCADLHDTVGDEIRVVFRVG